MAQQTAKEKAEELIMKMSFETHAYNAKHCALIAVDEILLSEKENHSILDKTYEYWQEVKQEIEKL